MSDETVYKSGKAGNGIDSSTLVAAALIFGGLALLAINVLHIQLFSFMWPLFVIGPGLLLMWPAYKSTSAHRHALAFLAVPGAMLAAFGGLLFVMDVTHHYEAMFYAWTLILAAAGGGYLFMNRYEPGDQARQKAHGFIRAMLLAFMGLAAMFEILIFRSLGGWWPLLLVGLGIYLLLKNRRVTS